MTREEIEQIFHINKEIKMWQRELDRLQCKSLVGSQNLDGLPKGNGTSDKVADDVINRVEIEEIINGKLAEIQVQRKRIMNYINSQEDSLLRQIIFLRNVSCMSWPQLARELNITEGCAKMIYYRHFRKE